MGLHRYGTNQSKGHVDDHRRLRVSERVAAPAGR
jgi:hypothetical protein